MRVYEPSVGSLFLQACGECGTGGLVLAKPCIGNDQRIGAIDEHGDMCAERANRLDAGPVNVRLDAAAVYKYGRVIQRNGCFNSRLP